MANDRYYASGFRIYEDRPSGPFFVVECQTKADAFRLALMASRGERAYAEEVRAEQIRKAAENAIY